MYYGSGARALAQKWLNGLRSSKASRTDGQPNFTSSTLTCVSAKNESAGGPSQSLQQVLETPPTAVRAETLTTTIDLATRSPSGIELDTIQWGERLDGPERCGPLTPGELEENSGFASPVNSSAHQAHAITLPTVKDPYMNRWRIPVLCLAFFIQGMSDSVTGALIPSMEKDYNVQYVVVSLLFVGNALGFIAAAPVCHSLNNHFGRARVLSSCALFNAIAYAAIICQPPWPVMVIAFFVLGFGLATILALDNVFVINLRGGTVLLGYMHGCYGIGGICGPFMATAMVSSGIRWSFFYFISLALSLLNAAGFWWTFRGYESESATTQLLAAFERVTSRPLATQERAGILRRAVKNRTTLLGALLIFAYQGAEVSISGWVISFLIDYRNGDISQVGYVTSGFWGGITLGRFVLVTPAHKLGDRLSITALIAGTAAFQFLVWFLPNVIGNAVAVAIIGFLLGPIYPCATGVFSRLLPNQLHITSLGLISSMGSSGGAIAPFVTGALAQRLGTMVLNPVCIVLYVVMELAWLGLPTIVKRTE